MVTSVAKRVSVVINNENEPDNQPLLGLETREFPEPCVPEQQLDIIKK